MSDWSDCDISTLQNAALSRDEDLSLRVPGDFEWYDGGLAFRNVEQPDMFFGIGQAARVQHEVVNIDSVTVWASGSEGFLRFSRPIPPPPKTVVVQVYVDPPDRFTLLSGSGKDIMRVDRSGVIHCAWASSVEGRLNRAVLLDNGWLVESTSQGLVFSQNDRPLMSLQSDGTLVLQGT